MKKLIVFLVAGLLTLSMSGMTFAADQLMDFSGGQFRAYGIFDNDDDFNSDVDDDEAWFEQRFRVPVTVNIGEGVTGNLRFDFSEANWGDETTQDTTWQRGVVGTNTIQVDRAFVTIDRGVFGLRIGQQWMDDGGHTLLYNGNLFGARFDLNLDPVTFQFNYNKQSEGVGIVDDGLDANDDTDLYGANLSYSCPAYTVGLMAAMLDDNPANDEKIGYGLYADAMVGSISLSAELDMFDGDNGAGVDYVGTNIYLAASMPVSDVFNLGAKFIFAPGTDDADEAQLPNLFNGGMGGGWYFADWDGALAANEGAFGGAEGAFEYYADSGVMGIAPYMSYAVTEAVTLYGKVAYMTANEDQNGQLIDPNNPGLGTDDWQSSYILNGSVDYQWLPSTTLSAGIGYEKPDFDNGNKNDDANVRGIAQIKLNW